MEVEIFWQGTKPKPMILARSGNRDVVVAKLEGGVETVFQST